MLLYCAYRANAIRKRSKLNTWGISTVGSALHSHCRGQRFESAMLHHKKSESCGFQTFCLPIFHRCCLEEPKLQFCFRVLIREAVGPAGLAAGMRCDLVPAHLPEADVRPAFAVLPADSFTLCFSRGCRYALLYHPVFIRDQVLARAGGGSAAGRRIPWSVTLNIIKQIPSSSLSGSPAPSRTDPRKALGV